MNIDELFLINGEELTSTCSRNGTIKSGIYQNGTIQIYQNITSQNIIQL